MTATSLAASGEHFSKCAILGRVRNDSSVPNLLGLPAGCRSYWFMETASQAQATFSGYNCWGALGVGQSTMPCRAHVAMSSYTVSRLQGQETASPLYQKHSADSAKVFEQICAATL